LWITNRLFAVLKLRETQWLFGCAVPKKDLKTKKQNGCVKMYHFAFLAV